CGEACAALLHLGGERDPELARHLDALAHQPVPAITGDPGGDKNLACTRFSFPEQATIVANDGAQVVHNFVGLGDLGVAQSALKAVAHGEIATRILIAIAAITAAAEGEK